MIADGAAHSLAGGPYAFAGCEVLVRDGGVVCAGGMELAQLESWRSTLQEGHRQAVETQLDRLREDRAAVAGLSFERPILMGVINVTPDSFYGSSRVDALAPRRRRR